MTFEDDTAGSVVAFYPKHNTHGRVDAEEFERWAKRYVAAHGGTTHAFDNHQTMHLRAREVLGVLDEHVGSRFVSVAFFCHGWARGVQAGFDLRRASGVHPNELARALARRSGAGVIVPLYACTTADEAKGPKHTDPRDVPGGDGGFADMLRDACAANGLTRVRVDAHDRLGRACQNPYVRRFEGDGTTSPQFGGDWIVAPTDVHWEAWKRRLDDDPDFAVTFPFLDDRTIFSRLEP